ncbi:MAG: TusE/DsrC/DsvC family sulfur relay protein [Lamprobacter sp.]|uniref:TusE/DsrC/DsvC family sulfur relay protein n=1 Tax=Lamprobacter sp. TaxID=3100796 RepID=UPI002B25B0F2|nr:TusE/DsrC/DsvC family sulfur relay protein [Lamprobacter sp.]MEA3641911.1 TusE/DsrC/DsvC family sulfur relay protein [Lamprobacter sp.]
MASQKSNQQPAPDDLERDDEPIDGRLHADMLDEYGFFKDPSFWNRDLALRLAAEMDLGELSEAHWRLIDRVRADYLDSGMLPVQPTLCHDLGLDPDCILTLFGGPIDVWRLAGLPNPGEEARTYMENQEAFEGLGTPQVPR